MKIKLSTLDWMLAIDFDNPRLLRIAKIMEKTQEFPVFIFSDLIKKRNIRNKVTSEKNLGY